MHLARNLPVQSGSFPTGNEGQPESIGEGMNMTKLLTRLRASLIVPILLFTILSPAWATTFYVAPNGNDSTGDGSSSRPWKTLGRACSQVTTSGNTIFVNAGTYTETAQSILAVGVNIEGPAAYPPTAIVTGTGQDPLVMVGTDAAYSDGQNQEIRYVEFLGSGYSGSAVRVLKRHRVKIHHCHFHKFNKAVRIAGMSSTGPPATYVSGIEVYNSDLSDNGGGLSQVWGGEPCIIFAGTTGAKIYNCNIDNTGRDRCISQENEGYNKGLKIYNNTLRAGRNQGPTHWRFAIEMWNMMDECEIYSNTIVGEVNHDTISYSGSAMYGMSIHDNTMYGPSSSPPGDNWSRAISFDGNCNGVRIYNNYIYNQDGGIHLWLASVTMQNFTISNNVFYNIGAGSGYFIDSGGSGSVNSAHIYNNYFDGATNGVSNGLTFDVGGSDFDIANNVFSYCKASYLTFGGSVSSSKVRNNLLYGNGNNNNMGGGGTGVVQSVNSVANPQISGIGTRPDPYYRPSGATSNLVDRGVYVGLGYVGLVPDIGVFEFGGGATELPMAPTSLRVAN